MTTELEVRDLTKHFAVGRGVVHRAKVHAADDVSFTLRPGTITALVGESGSGKSTIARLIARLYDPTSGQVVFEGRNVASEPQPRRPPALPLAGADDLPGPVRLTEPGEDGPSPPRATAALAQARPARAGSTQRSASCSRPSASCPPDQIAAKYPHELSGGQRQRVAIARALAVAPTVIVADEPTSMLDVSIRIGILNLMLDLKQERNLAFLYVTHDLACARYVADDVLVMYAGQIVEHGPAERVLSEPAAPVHRAAALRRPGPRPHRHRRLRAP